MFCGEEDARCQTEEELGRTWPFFFLGAGSVSVCLSQGSKSRGGPKYGTAQAQAHGTVRTKVQCPIPPVELQTRVPFSSLFSVSVSTSTSHPSSSSPPTNQPPFPPSPLIPSRRHCDLLKLDPTRATTRGEGSPPRHGRAGPGKVWHVIKPSRSVPPSSALPPGRLTQVEVPSAAPHTILTYVDDWLGLILETKVGDGVT